MDAGRLTAVKRPVPNGPNIAIGGLAPFFIARAGGGTFQFHTVGGRYVLLAFIGSSTAPLAADFLREVQGAGDVLDAERACVLTLSVDAADERLQSDMPGWRALFDPDGAISRLYGALEGGAYRPFALLLDRALRVMAGAPLAHAADLIANLREKLERGGEPPAHDHAPILVAPRILEPELCRALIAYFRAGQAEPSGFMREVDGKTVLVSDLAYKSRADVTIEDETLRGAIAAALRDRLTPLIERAWGWKATRVERYIVARYSAAENGRFRPHRDNMTKGTAHRKFAVSINLNDDFDGGDLRFPEYGTRAYRPTIGGAVVFGCRVLHEATPITRGDRYATLPFLYDEEGAAIRAANARFVETSPRPSKGP